MNNKLLKVGVLALVLVFGSMGGIVWASAGSQPGSFLHPVTMAVGKMGLTMTVDEVTETRSQMEFAQEQADEMQQLADDGRDDACPGGNCALARDRDRTRDCDDCDLAGDRDRTCDGDDCDLARDRDRDQDRTCDCSGCDCICGCDGCDPARDCDRDGDGGSGQSGGGHSGGHSGGQGGGGRN
jgi:uncharacterized membrane protein YgcG